MNTEEFKQEIKTLTNDQYNLLSWLATFIFNAILYPNIYNSQYYIGKQQGISSSCTFVGISDNLIFEVEINKMFSGLRNWNKLTYTQIFE